MTMSQSSVLRYQVLEMYKTFIRLSQNWTSSVPSQTGIEKNYILEETRKVTTAACKETRHLGILLYKMTII